MNIKSFFSNWIVRNILLAIVFVLVIVVAANVILAAMTRHGKEITVPDFTNMTRVEAARVAAESGVEVTITDSAYHKQLRPGVVYMQNPKAGSHVKEGRRIRLSVNTLKPQEVTMPNLVGVSLRQARAELLRNGLTLGRLIYVSDIATNNVIAQQRFGRNIEPGTKIASGSYVNLVLGLAPEDLMTFVPNVIGQKYQNAVGTVQNNSFNLGMVRFDSSVRNYDDSLNAVVYRQVPSVDSTSVVRGSDISLYLTLDANKLPSEK